MKTKNKRLAILLIGSILLNLLVFSGGGAMAAASDNGLVASYKFDKNLTDSSANGNNGTQSGTIGFVPGIAGFAASFDGKSYITVQDSDSLDLKAAFTFSVWLYKDYNFSHGTAPILQKLGGESSSGSVPYEFGDYIMYPYLRLSNDMGYGSYNSNVYVDMHKWELVTVTFDGNTLRTYLDGKVENEFDYNSEMLVSDEKLLIGKAMYQDGTTSNYKGCMDELQIFNRALSAVEAKALYDTAAKGASKDIVNHPNKLTAYYKLNGDTKDSTAFANNAKYVGTGNPAFVDALQGKGLKFTGMNYLEVSDSDSLELDKAFTMSAWVSLDSKTVDDDTYPVFGKQGCSADPQAPSYQMQLRHFQNNAHSTALWTYDKSMGSIPCATQADYMSSYKKWQMVTVTFDGSTAKTYIDGKMMNSTEYAIPILHSSGKLFIGKSAFKEGGSTFFIGMMDELRIYNYALSADDIKNLYGYRDILSTNPGASSIKTLKTGKTVALAVNLVTPEKASTNITTKAKYSSSNTKLLTVDAMGKVTAKAKGTVTLTISYGPHSLAVPITVN